MKTIERLKLFIDYKQVGLANFDKSIDAGKGYIGKQISRKASVGSDVLEKIFGQYPDLNSAWLLTGEGEMLKNRQFSANTHTADAHVSEPNMRYATNTPTPINRNSGKKHKQVDTPTDTPTRNFGPKVITVDNANNDNIAFVPVRARAGYLSGYGDTEYIEKLPAFNLPMLRTGTFRAFEVEGESMLPTLENGELVIGQAVENLEDIREDRVHIVVTKNDGVIIKRLLNRVNSYGYIIAKSDAIDNRHLYPNLKIAVEDVIEIWYAVMHINSSFRTPVDVYRRVNDVEADITNIKDILMRAGLLH